MKWIHTIKRTGTLQSHGTFFIRDSHFNESCFERDLKIITIVLQVFLNFVSAF